MRQVDGLVGTAEGLELGHRDRRAIATAVFASLSLCHCCGNLQRALQPYLLLVDCYVAEGSWDETKAPCSTPTNIAIVAIAAARQVDGLADGFRGPCIFNNHPACPCSQHSIGEVSFSGKTMKNTNSAKTHPFPSLLFFNCKNSAVAT